MTTTMTTTTTTAPKTRTITLTDRAPVTIREDEWPLIASAKYRPGSVRNGTPVPDYETDEYSIRVRQHADGRVLVYGVVDASTAWTGTEDRRGGILCPSYGCVIDAIRQVGVECNMPDRVIRECIADLPAEDI